MCGIVGVSLREPLEPHRAAYSLYYGLYALQHRGQESAGIVVSRDGEGSRISKGMGMVPHIFAPDDLKRLQGNVGIGHVRYSTTGSSRIENCQPFIIDYKDGSLAVAHNGNLVNYAQLRAGLEGEGRVFTSTTDTEVIAHLLVKELLIHKDLVEAVRELMRILVGAYSLTLLVNGRLVAIRDPLGIRPLCIGRLENGWVAASESVAIDTLGGRFLRDVKPGEILMFNGADEEPRSARLYRAATTAHCIFEYIYLARPDAILDGRLVYDTRVRIGELLAEEHPAEADVVTSVPDSGVASAIGYSDRSGIPYRETLMKNRYVGRTFIMPEAEMRDIAVKLKLNVLGPQVKDKRVIVVDDSIVRGTTVRRIVDSLKARGAREVHMRIGSPPITSPCYLGVDMKSKGELIASQHSVEEVRRFIHADSLGYLSLGGLVRAVGMTEKHLCTGCLTGVYPVEVPGEKWTARQMKLSHFTP
ncbi:MAG: amidophosphoribosyltransferase [Euryarchaeota archaeon]|nr:amidophosphoribosyltransferase [Euryarchaeota archaeon]